MEQYVTLKWKIEVAIEAIDNNKFQCIAVPNCDYVQKGKVYHGNFIRHVRVNHPDKLEVLGLPLSEKDEEPKPKRKKTGKLTVETTVKDVLLGTLQLTTSNALPLSYPEWVGIKTLVGPLWKAANLSINRKSLTELTVKASVLARELLAAEIKGRPLHLKMDSASRRSHHSFAVNAAFYKDGQIVTRSLVIKEMIISQTASNLCQTMVEEVIQKFGILPEQILTIAHDNGANMVASVTSLRRYIKESSPNLLTKELKAIDEVIATLSDRRLADMFEVDAANDEIIAAQDDEEIEEEPHKENEQENHEDNTEQDDNDEDVRYSDDEAYDVLSITSTRCAAHTCQLAVWDVLKKYSKRIENIKKLCQKTRLVKYRTSFATHKAHLPPIPGQTRWNSVYLMVKALREQKSFFLMLQSEFDEMNFSKHWASIELLCEALEPLFFLTVMLQKEHVPLSEFYTEWLICQAKLNSLTTNHLAKKLLNAMEKRLHKLTETPQFKACLYIDPRFNYIGSNRMSLADKEIAQKNDSISWNIGKGDVQVITKCLGWLLQYYRLRQLKSLLNVHLVD
ncbi:uncharacterized protein LOC134209808 [Armigeres subalbatus]|uniref:uncharacterized protein LOC134209808 n=1 Tax=Armigeres subalbatus TaxID=124917 RepID=UPI002ED598E2